MHSEPNETNAAVDPAAVERVRERRTELAPALGRTWTDGDPWRFLTDLTAIGSRMAGSEGERRAAEIVADAFERAGLSAVETRPFEMAAVGARERDAPRDGARTRRRGGDPRVRGARAAVLAGRECHWGARGRGVRHSRRDRRAGG